MRRLLRRSRPRPRTTREGAAPPLCGYVAPRGFEAQLDEELAARFPGRRVVDRHGKLVLVELEADDDELQHPAWSALTWLAPEKLPARSVREAAEALRERQAFWAPLGAPKSLRRREALVQAALPRVPSRPQAFPPRLAPRELPPLGAWTLLDRETMLASARTSSPWAGGAPSFKEDRQNPPSRAYLKLWEVMTREPACRPARGDVCLDLGSCPGGWTWVLQRLGARVVAVDKAALAPRVLRLPGVEERRESAFALEPATDGPVDWVFSDMACYPERLYTLVQRWLAVEGAVRRGFVCTLKFQGDTDHETAARFAAIPGSRLVHLSQNKHELTWILVRDDAAAAAAYK